MDRLNAYRILGSVSNIMGLLIFIAAVLLLVSMISPLYILVLIIVFHPWLTLGMLGGLAIMCIVFSVVSARHATDASTYRMGLVCGIGTLVAIACLLVFFYPAFVGFSNA